MNIYVGNLLQAVTEEDLRHAFQGFGQVTFVSIIVGNAGVPTHHSSRAVTLSTIRNLCTIMAGAKPISMRVEIKTEATDVRQYGFSLPNGDRLLAVWTDGVAVDEDPGIEATVRLPVFSPKNVSGIDVLHGFEQELVTQMKDGKLVMRDLLIKDYPIIFRLSD